METLQDAYRDDEDDTGTLSPDSNPNPNPNFDPDPNPPPTTPAGPPLEAPLLDSDPKSDPMPVDSAALMTNTEDLSSESISEGEQNIVDGVPGFSGVKKLRGEDIEGDEETATLEGTATKKTKSLSLDQIDASVSEVVTPSSTGINGSKKSSKKKSKSNSVWTKPTSRKGKKKAKNYNGSGGNINNGNNHAPLKTEDAVLVTPMPRFPDKNDDSKVEFPGKKSL